MSTRARCAKYLGFVLLLVVFYLLVAGLTWLILTLGCA